MWIPQKYKWPAGGALFLFMSFLYGITNRFDFSLLDFPRRTFFFPETFPLEKNLPYIPSMIWIYFSFFIYLPLSLFLNRCPLSLNRHFRSLLFLILVSHLLFVIFPSHLPREEGMISSSGFFLEKKLILLLHQLDQPQNSFPSLHVGISYLIAFGFLDDLRSLFPWMFTWAHLLLFSTLTLKQHTFCEVAGGIFLAGLSFFLFHRFPPLTLTQT